MKIQLLDGGGWDDFEVNGRRYEIVDHNRKGDILE
jgi:hypothetical protein